MEQKHLDYLAQLGPIMPADVPPPMPGWYARDYGADFSGPERWLEARDYWDGEHWYTGLNDGRRSDKADVYPPMPWRGLAQPAEWPWPTGEVPAPNAERIADAMAADARDLVPVDVVTVGPNGATRSEDAKVVPTRQNDAQRDFEGIGMDGDMFAPKLSPRLFYSALAAIVVVIAFISWLVK